MSVDWEELVPLIAHDVRALVRKGLSNAQFLERLLGPAADAQASTHVRAIVESQVDLNRLVIRLVALADAETPRRRSSPHAQETTDLETAVLGAKLECRDALDRAGAELVVEPLPACTVPQKVQIVLRELIDNSIRYRDPERPLRVAIDARVVDETRIRVRVKDNGTGFSAMYADRLFQPLQRLDSVRSGFGLGLAISRAIIEAAGGTIHTEPSDSGASFAFELPNYS